MDEPAYCVARIGELVETTDGVTVEFTEHQQDTFEALVEFLKSTYDRFATLVADRNAAGKYHSKLDLSKIGGFGIQLSNRFGSSVEVGVGREWWMLMSLDPTYAVIDDPPFRECGLDFYVDGWHRTEFDAQCLISQSRCLEILKNWLETNALPKCGA